MELKNEKNPTYEELQKMLDEMTNERDEWSEKYFNLEDHFYSMAAALEFVLDTARKSLK